MFTKFLLFFIWMLLDHFLSPNIFIGQMSKYWIALLKAILSHFRKHHLKRIIKKRPLQKHLHGIDSVYAEFVKNRLIRITLTLLEKIILSSLHIFSNIFGNIFNTSIMKAILITLLKICSWSFCLSYFKMRKQVCKKYCRVSCTVTFCVFHCCATFCKDLVTKICLCMHTETAFQTTKVKYTVIFSMVSSFFVSFKRVKIETISAQYLIYLIYLQYKVVYLFLQN